MSHITELTISNIKEIQEEIYNSYPSKNSLQEAFQDIMNIIYEKLSQSIVLGRIFHLLEMRDLPDYDKNFVNIFAEKKGVRYSLNRATKVLSLMATKGKEEAWNDRTLSRGHLGIPLVSADFLNGIPMMASLLNAIGVVIPGIIDIKKIDIELPFSYQGTFIVENAKEAVDGQNRKVIADQGFVEKYQIQSVLGFGNQQFFNYSFCVAVFFLRDSIPKKNIKVKTFNSLLNVTLSKVANHFLNRGALFP